MRSGILTFFPKKKGPSDSFIMPSFKNCRVAPRSVNPVLMSSFD